MVQFINDKLSDNSDDNLILDIQSWVYFGCFGWFLLIRFQPFAGYFKSDIFYIVRIG